MAMGSISGQRVDLSNVSGVLPVENGGTGVTSVEDIGNLFSSVKVWHAQFSGSLTVSFQQLVPANSNLPIPIAIFVKMIGLNIVAESGDNPEINLVISPSGCKIFEGRRGTNYKGNCIWYMYPVGYYGVSFVNEITYANFYDRGAELSQSPGVDIDFTSGYCNEAIKIYANGTQSCTIDSLDFYWIYV